ncbi:MAG: hypothetical protein OXC03_05090 [Flavobacteriaceae bacterium]|nr:hypothetical protein [Flavobacteriaceae bacterium]
MKNLQRGRYYRIVADLYIKGELSADKIVSRGLATLYGENYCMQKRIGVIKSSIYPINWDPLTKNR